MANVEMVISVAIVRSILKLPSSFMRRMPMLFNKIRSASIILFYLFRQFHNFILVWGKTRVPVSSKRVCLDRMIGMYTSIIHNWG